ncbi:carboxypeptidase-like regulatory domain-containing protein [[Eubacterium] cellulosolvens]
MEDRGNWKRWLWIRFLIILLVVNFAILNYYINWAHLIDKDEIDDTHYFAFIGEIRDGITNEPIDNASVKVEVEWVPHLLNEAWFKRDETKYLEPPTYTMVLGETNSTHDGRYFLTVPTVDKSSIKSVYYDLKVSKADYINTLERFYDTGKWHIVHFIDIFMFCPVNLTGRITNLANEPLENALIMLTHVSAKRAPCPVINHSTYSISGSYKFTNLCPVNNFDIIIACQGYQTKIFENISLLRQTDTTLDATLHKNYDQDRKVHITGRVLINDLYSEYLFYNEKIFIWCCNDQSFDIEILNLDETGRFSGQMRSGYYYFVPIVAPPNQNYQWEFAYQLIEIYDYIFIEIRGSK